MKVSVIGAGYLGVTHAASLAELGHTVLCVDRNLERVERLSKGELPFYEPDLPELLWKHVSSGALRFSASVPDAAMYADLHFICVGTPQTDGGHAADLSQVERSIHELGECLRPGSVVVGKSTVPVGTAARMAPIVEASGATLAWNPEFLREGSGVRDTLHPDRIVVGVREEDGAHWIQDVYKEQLRSGIPLLVTDYATAELVKVAANAFLATKISFINAMAEVCEAADADVVQLATAIGHDSRIGHQFLSAGLGFGGGCLPKDIRAFMARAEELGVDQALTFLKNIDDINVRRRARMVELVREVCGPDLVGKRVAILGAAFKPHSDDIRDSPALDVAVALHVAGGEVRVFDPAAMANARKAYPALQYANSALEACHSADAVLHLTEWPEFLNLSPEKLDEVVGGKVILDGRNVLDPALWRQAGWQFRALGRR